MQHAPRHPHTIDPPPHPERLAATRLSWHVLAGHVLAEERWRRAERIGLHPRPDGLRTPLDDGVGVELVGRRLLVHQDGRTREAPVTSLHDARRIVLGTDQDRTRWSEELPIHDPPPTVPADQPLEIDTGVAHWLGAWFTLGEDVLGALGRDDASTEASPPTLWPEHLDIAIEVLPEDQRGSYGLSPGDDGVPEPYAYVAVWYPDRVGGLDDPRWNGGSFPGALLRAHELAEVDDAATHLLDWFRERRDLLAALTT